MSDTKVDAFNSMLGEDRLGALEMDGQSESDTRYEYSDESITEAVFNDKLNLDLLLTKKYDLISYLRLDSNDVLMIIFDPGGGWNFSKGGMSNGMFPRGIGTWESHRTTCHDFACSYPIPVSEVLQAARMDDEMLRPFYVEKTKVLKDAFGKGVSDFVVVEIYITLVQLHWLHFYEVLLDELLICNFDLGGDWNLHIDWIVSFIKLKTSLMVGSIAAKVLQVNVSVDFYHVRIFEARMLPVDRDGLCVVKLPRQGLLLRICIESRVVLQAREQNYSTLDMLVAIVITIEDKPWYLNCEMEYDDYLDIWSFGCMFAEMIVRKKHFFYCHDQFICKIKEHFFYGHDQLTCRIANGIGTYELNAYLLKDHLKLDLHFEGFIGNITSLSTCHMENYIYLSFGEIVNVLILGKGVAVDPAFFGSEYFRANGRLFVDISDVNDNMPVLSKPIAQRMRCQLTTWNRELVIGVVGALDQGGWFHSFVEPRKTTSAGVLGIPLNDMYAKSGLIDMICSVITYTDLIQIFVCRIYGWAIHGENGKELELLRRKENEDIEPNEVVIIGELKTCTQMGLVNKDNLVGAGLIAHGGSFLHAHIYSYFERNGPNATWESLQYNYRGDMGCSEGP